MQSLLQQFAYDFDMVGLVRYINFSEDMCELSISQDHDMGLVRIIFDDSEEGYRVDEEEPRYYVDPFEVQPEY